jgi:RHS repeat-associated protein
MKAVQRNRNPEDWTYTNIPDDFPVMRGYTGHEHLKWFGLINMNGRMYDASLCRFLSPDPYVQMPDYSQNFNRYSYALNNPLVYTDPSGEFLT